MVFAVGLIGCTPEEVYRFGDDNTTCVALMDSVAALFNDLLGPLVEELNAELSNASFTYINTEANVITTSASNTIGTYARF